MLRHWTVLDLWPPCSNIGHCAQTIMLHSNYTTLFTDYRTNLPITGHYCKLQDSNCRNQWWFLQLELCNSRSANPHRCVGHSGLHDICPADDSAELMTSGWLVSRENGRNVSQITASS